MESKKTVQDFPYKTFLNILHGPLELIDVQKLADACKDKWYNETLCKVNDSAVRLGVLQGEYHWHEHNDIDEFYFVLDRNCVMDLDDKTVELVPGPGFLVPKVVRERPIAHEGEGSRARRGHRSKRARFGPYGRYLFSRAGRRHRLHDRLLHGRSTTASVDRRRKIFDGRRGHVDGRVRDGSQHRNSEHRRP